MNILGRLTNITIAFGEKDILQHGSAEILEGAIIGIVGGNGEGKSSLLSVLAGLNNSYSGHVEWIGNTPSISYVKQEEEHFHSFLENEYTSKWFVPKETDFSFLSGGEKIKKRLSKAFAENNQLLLLDEPTNHLDQDSLGFLIESVQQYKGTVIIVSHDRYFLDIVAEYIWEIENKRLTVYHGNYSAYRERKEQNRQTQQRLYDKQQSKISLVEKQIAELTSWSSKAHKDSTKKEGYKEYWREKAKRKDNQIKSKRKRLELELSKNKVEKPDVEKEISFTIEGNKKKGKRIIEAKQLKKSFGDKLLFENASFTIQAQERIGIIGPNGSGKSTLLKMLMEKETQELWLSSSLKIGYLQQTVFDLPEELTPAEIFSPSDFEERGLIQTLMVNLGFSKDQWHRPVSTMSMGERVKVKLMEFMLDEKDLLVLDEPTNHLDLPSREQLERTLATFPGTILLVTQDRYFLEKLTDKLLVIENKTIRRIEQSYRDWMNPTNETSKEQELLRLETERQAVLGELSFLDKKHPRYEVLNQQFMHLTKLINQIKR